MNRFVLTLMTLSFLSALRAQETETTSFPNTVVIGLDVKGMAPDAVVIGAAAKTAAGDLGMRSVAGRFS